MNDNLKITGVVMVFDRPQYTYEFIKSLERCTDINDIDWIFLQDGAVNKFSNDRVANDEDIQKNINIIETADIPNKEIRKNEYNLSIALQRDKMFDLFGEGYDLILQFENDLQLGKYAVRLFKILAKQFDESLTSLYRYKTFTEINNYKDKLDLAIESEEYNERFYLYTLGIWEDTFRKIENDWNKYIDIIGDIDYRNKPSNLSQNKFDGINGASDAVIRYLVRQNNINKIHLAVNRTSYIGAKGFHQDPNDYSKWKYGNEGPLKFEQDNKINKFRLK